jgi:hypothetical protein
MYRRAWVKPKRKPIQKQASFSGCLKRYCLVEYQLAGITLHQEKVKAATFFNDVKAGIGRDDLAGSVFGQ